MFVTDDGRINVFHKTYSVWMKKDLYDEFHERNKKMNLSKFLEKNMELEEKFCKHCNFIYNPLDSGIYLMLENYAFDMKEITQIEKEKKHLKCMQCTFNEPIFKKPVRYLSAEEKAEREWNRLPIRCQMAIEEEKERKRRNKRKAGKRKRRNSSAEEQPTSTKRKGTAKKRKLDTKEEEEAFTEANIIVKKFLENISKKVKKPANNSSEDQEEVNKDFKPGECIIDNEKSNVCDKEILQNEKKVETCTQETDSKKET